MPIKAVFFDVYNTLAHFDPSPMDIQVAACREMGIAVTPEGIAQGYALADQYMAQEEARQPMRARSREERERFFGDYQRLVLKGAGVEVSPEQALEVFRQVRLHPTQLAPFDDVAPALGALSSKGKTLGLLTNINLGSSRLASSPQELCQRLGIEEYVSLVVTSEEAGSTKPHPPIFLAALRKASVQPHEAVHVGDQYHSDIVGAQGVGIHPVLIDRADTHPDFQECPRIRSLLELPDLLNGYDEGLSHNPRR